MPLLRPSTEDQRKIHAEITQIVNQRLQLTTFAITVFGVIGAWLIPKSPPSARSPLGAFTFVTTDLLITLLFALYCYSHVLKGMLRVFTAYLAVTKASGWEQDWERYRAGGYGGYTKAQTIVFLILIGISTAMPKGLSVIFDLRPEPAGAFWATVVMGVIYLAAVAAMGFLRWLDPEQNAQNRWEALDRPVTVVVGLGEYFQKLRQGILRHLEVVELIDAKPVDRLQLSSEERLIFRQGVFGWPNTSLDRSVECAMLLSPPGIHVNQIEILADTSATIFVEKPLATSLADIDRLKRAVAKNPHIYCSDHYSDVNAAPLLAWLKPEGYPFPNANLRVDRGDTDIWTTGPSALGELKNINAVILEHSGFENRPWLGRYDEGGVVLDLMYHCFSLCARVTQGQLAVESVVRKKREGEVLVELDAQPVAETYAEVRGYIGAVRVCCEVAKYWPEEVRKFEMKYEYGVATMMFGSPNRLILRTPTAECRVTLLGDPHELVIARFVDYVRLSTSEPHGLNQALWAIEACDLVRQFVRNAKLPHRSD